MLKFLGFLIVVGAAFAIGYQMGRQGPDVVLKKARDIGTEVVSKATTFERSQSVRGRLLNAKDRLVQAKADLLEKNYGNAVMGLEETAQTLAQIKSDVEQELRPRFDALQKKVADLAVDAKALKPNVMTRLNEAVKEVDALLNR